jgi:hypothetical protein
LDNHRSELINPKRLREVAAVELAVAYLDGTSSPHGEDMRGIDNDPTWLGLTLSDKPSTPHTAETEMVGVGAKKRS